MLDTRTNEWMARLQAQGPRLATLTLGALIVIELGRAAYAFLSAPPVKSPQPVLSGTARMARSEVNVQSVVSAHLFGVAVDPAAQDPANARQSSANLVLAGTIATQDPKRGVAIVSEGGAPAKVYSVGDNIGGAALHSVFLDHVILDRSGTLETLPLPRLLSAAMHAPPIVRRTAASDPRTAAAVDNIRKMVEKDPTILDQVMRTVASYDNAAGKLRGFRAYPGRNRQIFSKLGLRSGDLVTAINGTPLDDPQHSQEVFNTIQSSDHVTVTVERAGEKQDITLNIAQVAAQASKDLEESNGSGATSAPGGDAAGAGASGAPAGAAPPGGPAPNRVPLGGEDSRP